MNKVLFIILALLITQTCFAQELIQDNFVIDSLSNKKLENPQTNLKYDYSNTKKIKIPLRIKETVKSEKFLHEGQILEFETTDSIYNESQLLIPKYQIVKARVETIIKNGMNGIPASIVLGNFQTDGIDSNKLSTTIEIFGKDLSLLVFPLKWALTFLPPTGSLTNFIVGGHAKIKTNKIIEIYYYQ